MQALRDIKAKTEAIPLYTSFSDKGSMGAWDAYIAVAATGGAEFCNNKLVHMANPFSDRGTAPAPTPCTPASTAPWPRAWWRRIP